MERDEVDEAIEMLMEEISRHMLSLSEEIAETLRSGNYERVRLLLEQASALKEFQQKVQQLKNQEWNGLMSKPQRRQRAAKSKSSGRLPQGQRTPAEVYRRPILEALVELGGRAPAGRVLDLVERKVSHLLNEFDFEPMPSDPDRPRWRYAAHSCRTVLVGEGLMKRDSPYGMWEISEAGRKWLEEQQ